MPIVNPSYLKANTDQWETKEADPHEMPAVIKSNDSITQDLSKGNGPTIDDDLIEQNKFFRFKKLCKKFFKKFRISSESGVIIILFLTKIISQ